MGWMPLFPAWAATAGATARPRRVPSVSARTLEGMRPTPAGRPAQPASATNPQTASRKRLARGGGRADDVLGQLGGRRVRLDVLDVLEGNHQQRTIDLGHEVACGEDFL